MTVDRVGELAPSCRTCLVWELDAVRRGQVPAGGEQPEKEAWVSQVLREWGSCGRVVLVDDEVVGHVLYAPPAFVPGAAAVPTAPVSPDAVVLTTLWVHPRHRHGGLARLLVQGMAKDLVARDIRAVEAFATTRRTPHGCLVPAEVYGRVGFKTQRAHRTSPRMRMELRSALTWMDEVEQALERLLGAVRPLVQPPPQASRPVGRGLRRTGPEGPDPTQISSASSLSRAALGRAPTMDFTTSPPW